MADNDRESKTEEPTEKKIREARERGNVPASREVSTLACIAALAAFMGFSGPSMLATPSATLSVLVDAAAGRPLDTIADVSAVVMAVLFSVAAGLAPFMLLLAAAAIAASAMQNAPALVLDRIVPKAERISPVSGARRLFGKPALVEFGKAFAKLAATSLAVTWVMVGAPEALLSGMLQQTGLFGDVVWDMAIRLVLTVAAAMTIIALADLAWSRRDWMAQLRMTRQEIKDELRQAEGDPIVKARLRSLGRDRARRRMMRAVETATLVVANPTHYAVALRYRRGQDSAPVVVAKGQDILALRIREIAETSGVSVFEDVALARSLHRAVKIDQEIPAVFFAAIAELVRIVHARQSGPATI